MKDEKGDEGANKGKKSILHSLNSAYKSSTVSAQYSCALNSVAGLYPDDQLLGACMRWTLRNAKDVVLQAKHSRLLPYGSDKPLFASTLNWLLERDASKIYAIFGPASSLFVESVLLARARSVPQIVRPFANGRSLNQLVHRVKLSTRLQGTAFTDYTARYGKLLEEDKQTLVEHLRESLALSGMDIDDTELHAMSKQFQINHLLEMPLIALSNGQTRRARIMRSILMKPQLLILEEPLTGLDDRNRILIEELLYKTHQTLSPQIIFTLRTQDHVPDYISHVVQTIETDKGFDIAYIGPRASWRPMAAPSTSYWIDKPQLTSAKALVILRNVNVTGRTPVLMDVNWTIKEGERWHLRGPNGSGKSTLLSMITGDHPQSYHQDLTLFSKPRYSTATPLLQRSIGHVSPEIFNAFPRRYPGLNAREVIGTGYENIFSYRTLSSEQLAKIDDLAIEFNINSLMETSFSELTGANQSLILFLRALIKSPPLLILDEPFAGMNEKMIRKCHDYIDNKLDPKQAIILVTHFLEEKPQSFDRLLQLENGKVVKQV